MTKFTLALIALVVALPLYSAEAPAPSDLAARIAAVQKLVQDLKPHTGEVTLRGGVARIKLPAEFTYLDTKDTETVLTRIWGNPNGGGTLGMIT